MSTTEIKLRSWSIAHWPADVFPNDPNRARRICRVHRSELMACGALARVGRELVVFAEAYNKWVRSKAARVGGYEIAANKDRDAAIKTRENAA